MPDSPTDADLRKALTLVVNTFSGRLSSAATRELQIQLQVIRSREGNTARNVVGYRR